MLKWLPLQDKISQDDNFYVIKTSLFFVYGGSIFKLSAIDKDVNIDIC